MPEFFQFGDDISLRLKHLQSINGFNAMEAELAMLDYIPVAKLREFPRPSSNIIKQRAARLQELLHHLRYAVWSLEFEVACNKPPFAQQKGANNLFW